MTRLAILSKTEQREFELPPKFSKNERILHFDVNSQVRKVISRMEDNSRVGFILQLGYFKANARFYSISQFRKRDIQFVSSSLNNGQFDVEEYTQSVYRHRKKILQILNWPSFDEDSEKVLSDFSDRQASNQLAPRNIFIGLIDQCWKHRIPIPSYRYLCEMITDSFNHTEQLLLNQLSEATSEEHLSYLERLLDHQESREGRASPYISSLKKINHGLKPNQIQENVDITSEFKRHYRQLESIFPRLHMSDSATKYYATWFEKADFQQINQFNLRSKVYLRCLAFIKHQFFKRQDMLAESLLKSVTACSNAAKSKLLKADLETRKERDKAILLLNQSHISYSTFAKAVVSVVESKHATPNEKYYKIETLVDELQTPSESEEKRLRELDKLLSKDAKNQTYYEILESLSIKLQRRVTNIVKCLDFDETTSDSDIISAINYFKNSNGLICEKAPLAFLDANEMEVIKRDGKIITSLYKTLLFFRISDRLKSGELNLNYSYRFRAIQDYLIEKKYWEENKPKILKESGLIDFIDGEQALESLSSSLNTKYEHVNKRILENKNTYFTLNRSNRPTVKTPSIEKENLEYIGNTLSQRGITSILDVLRSINQTTEFTGQFTHFTNKNAKLRPTHETLFAGVISKGCNIGVSKMANISSGVKEHILQNTVNWCFSLQNIKQANDMIVKTIHSLDLANNYVHRPNVIHSSSDGRKVNVAVESLQANYSFKYFGKDKGVTMYTFIDERQALFYSTAFTSSDREAPYVIDGLLHNSVPHERIHSTDTHGFTEQVFAATHFIGVDFAPRFKDLGSQRIYSFSAKRTYAKQGFLILPSRTIARQTILKKWDDILRFMATIKLQYSSASQLFKRLSSYAKTHPLYKALKEFGRIIKSLYILTYYDDLALRQQVQKQLNRIELTNKFAHAVFFDNDQSFQEPETEQHEVSTACQMLLQNAIILWNYLSLSKMINENKSREERMEIIDAVAEGSIITWRHINLRGEYDFTKKAANDEPFNLSKLRSIRQ